MLRIAEQWYRSDVGRQRQGNEDNFFVRAPLFVVADGMGGAQAGEVASQMAVEEFEPGMPNGRPEDSLVQIIRAANRKIHEMSRSDAQRSGMGTTLTAVYVTEKDVVLAHVGDSRCYLLRHGELTRLTRDHSLVGELVDRGKLTEEQAEIHPQRSVITRALGPEPDVQVDVQRIEARAGDLFLLCSDGLTSMVREHDILPVLTQSPSLAEAGEKLIAAANEAGGRDNITVVLFRLEDVEVARAGTDQATAEATAVTDDDYDTFEGPAVGSPRQGATRASAAGGAAGPAGARATDEEEAAYRRDATVALQAVTPAAPPSSPPPPPPRTAPLPPTKKKKRRRVPAGLVVTLVFLAIVGISAWLAIRAVFFIGTDPQTRAVTVYRGLPYELPLGIDLYTTHYTSGVTLDQVPPARRTTFTDHKLRSLDDASDLVRQLELGKLDR
jgi:serine/threonine protein phosphatase PrpC